ncbi:MAG: hypothetical protein ABEH66_01330 [Halobacteriales archaeon]
MADPDPNYTLDQYITQLRNTVHAAYEDGYDRAEIHNRFEGLLFELREEHEPRIDSPEKLRAELDLFLRDAYLPTGEVVDVLRAKAEELEGIGEEAGEVPLDTDADEIALDADGDVPGSANGDIPTDTNGEGPVGADGDLPIDVDELGPDGPNEDDE